MPTPAERIYDAAAAALDGQQARANQITNAMGPLGAGAAAATLLLKPALHDISQASTPQTVGVVAGVIGLALVLVAGIAVLIGVPIDGVEPGKLVDIASGPPDLLGDAQTFDLNAAADLGRTLAGNDGALQRLQALFVIVAFGLVCEVSGLAVAAEIQPHPKSQPSKQASARLRLTSARVRGTGVALIGQLEPNEPGDVDSVVVLHGRGSERIMRAAPLRDGRFSVRVIAIRGLRPIRSVSYTLTWTESHTVASARLTGNVRRG
jgi:hypothetical protein